MNDTITIVGTIGTDPEKKIRNGVPITTFRVASKERRFDRSTGSWVDGETNWYTASAYRRLAEHAFDSLHRRERVVLTGRLRVRNWDTGEKRGTSVDIDIDAIGHDLLFGTSTFRSDEPRFGGVIIDDRELGDGRDRGRRRGTRPASSGKTRAGPIRRPCRPPRRPTTAPTPARSHSRGWRRRSETPRRELGVAHFRLEPCPATPSVVARAPSRPATSAWDWGSHSR